VFKDQYEDRGMNCGGEKVFGRESKIIVWWSRSNVKLKKIFHENWVHDKRDWFALK